MNQITLSDAADLIEDGMTIALGGMTLYRRPVAFVKALLNRRTLPSDLTLMCFTAGYESDLLVGAGCVKTVRSAYFGLETFGFAPMFTQAVQQGGVQLIEETEASIVLGIRAGLSGVDFMPSRSWIGTDLLDLRPDVKTIDSPYSAEQYVAFPAIHIDVTVIHGVMADQQGNVMINNNLAIDPELVYLGKTVIATVETIQKDDLTPQVSGQILPYPAIDYIVPAQNGALPTSCHPLYPVDGDEILRYIDACQTGKFTHYITEL